MLTSRDRVLAALNHSQPDCTPCDYFSTPEIHERLVTHFGLTFSKRSRLFTHADNAVSECLGTDIRYIKVPYTGPPLPTFNDGSVVNVWGVRRRPMPNEYGEYAEPVGTPYAGWQTVEEAAAFSWPSPDWYDYAAVPTLCKAYPNMAVAAGDFHVQDFINGVAFGRGMEQVLIDIAMEDPVFMYIVERRHAFYMEHIDRTLAAGRGRIDLVLCGDDFGSQRGLLISPVTFDRLFAERKKEFFDMVHSHGARVTHHCCGSSRELLPRFISCGMDSLQTIQARAVGMDPYLLKKDFGDKITLHGAVDVQGWLQTASVSKVKNEVNRLMDEVGAGGGFIIAPSHFFQPDTPVENVLAFYETVRQRRPSHAPNFLSRVGSLSAKV